MHVCRLRICVFLLIRPSVRLSDRLPVKFHIVYMICKGKLCIYYYNYIMTVYLSYALLCYAMCVYPRVSQFTVLPPRLSE